MTSTAQVTWVDGMQFVGEAGSGHAIVLDGRESVGGRDTGPRPMELLLVGLAGCTAMDVKFMLQRRRQQVTGVQVKVEAERAYEHPKVYKKIIWNTSSAGETYQKRPSWTASSCRSKNTAQPRPCWARPPTSAIHIRSSKTEPSS